MISTGDQTKENLDLLENKEGSDGFCRELRMRIFILMGYLNPWGLHAGESRMRIFDLQRIKNSYKLMLGSDEDSDNFTRELRMRIFILLKNENSVGRRLTVGG